MSNLTPSTTNIEYAIFMHTNYVYSTSNPIYLTLFQLFQVNSCLSTFLSFYKKHFFASLFLLVILISYFFCLRFTWFLWVSVIFSWSCNYFLLQDKLVKISDFPSYFAIIFSSLPVLTINSLKKGYLETLNLCQIRKFLTINICCSWQKKNSCTFPRSFLQKRTKISILLKHIQFNVFCFILLIFKSTVTNLRL